MDSDSPSPSPSPDPDHRFFVERHSGCETNEVKEEEGLLSGKGGRTIHMVKEKVTKNTVRYAASPSDGTAPPIKTVYIEKWALGKTNPPTISLTLNF